MPYLEGALVAIDNASGGIRALVGGRDYAQSKFNRALAPANRQVGSVLQAVCLHARVHARASARARRSAMGRSSRGKFRARAIGRPGNSDGTYGGIQPVSYGLIHSRNTMSVRVGEFAGLDDVQKIATTLGLGENIPHGAGDLHRLVRNRPEGSHRGLHRFSERRRAQTVLHHRADRRSGSQSDLSRGARRAAGARPGAAWMTSQLMEEVLTQRNGGERAVVRLQASGRG